MERYTWREHRGKPPHHTKMTLATTRYCTRALVLALVLHSFLYEFFWALDSLHRFLVWTAWHMRIRAHIYYNIIARGVDKSGLRGPRQERTDISSLSAFILALFTHRL